MHFLFLNKNISVYIQNGVPNIYPDDDLTNDAQILSWVEEESKVNTIKSLSFSIFLKENCRIFLFF